MDKNYWLDKKLRREQLKYRQDFMRCLSQGGSWIIDWDGVYEKSGFGKPPDAGAWCQKPFDFGYDALEDTIGSD